MKTGAAAGAGIAVAALLWAAAGGAQDSGRSAVSPAPAPPQAKSEEEKRILDVLLDLDRNPRRGMMNVPMEDGRMLRLLVENSGAKHVVEIGTSNGFSGLWICMGLKATGGKLTTHEIDAGRAALARENFRKAGVESIVTLVEGDAHKEVGKLEGPIDVVFLDADKEGYVDYLKQLLPKVRPGGLLLAHNVTSHGRDLKEYLEAVTTDPALETLYVNRHMAGMSVTLKKR